METWFVLEDDDVAAPADVRRQPDGSLKHRDGRAVAMKGDVPRSRSVDPEEVAKVRAKAERAKPAARDMKADDSKPAYTTRESKAE